MNIAIFPFPIHGPVVIYWYESWTIKKAECQRIDAFELGCWRRLLRVPWTTRRSNQSILKEISPEYSLEGLILTLKLQYFGHLMQRTDSLEKDPDAEQDWRQEEKGTTEDKMAGWPHQLYEHEFEQAPGAGDGQGSLVCCSPWSRKESDTTEWLNWIHGPLFIFSCLIVLPETTIIILKRTIRMDIVALGLPFVLHFRMSFLQQFTVDICFSLLASLVMRGGGAHVSYSQWSCPSQSSKKSVMIWIHSFFCLFSMDTGVFLLPSPWLY